MEKAWRGLSDIIKDMNMQNLKSRVESFMEAAEEVPELRYAGDAVLRQTAQQSTLEEGLALSKLLERALLSYRKVTGLGRGLAAPQIGESKSVFITYVDDEIRLFINPTILEKSEETNFYRELCMSVGVLAADVERPEWVVLGWTTETGERKTEKFEGFEARLLQHEEAHLRGVLNIDCAASGGIEFVTFDPKEEVLRKS